MAALRLTDDLSALARTVRFGRGSTALFRPLERGDVDALAEMLVSFSDQTRRYWNLGSYDRAMALELCDAIGRHDKLRMVAEETFPPFRLLASFEFSFDIPEDDRRRFAAYGVALDAVSDCRFGPCVRDAVQGSGLAHAMMPPTMDIARRFGRSRILLWGGVEQENRRAIRFYEKHGFEITGASRGSQGRPSLDMLLQLA